MGKNNKSASEIYTAHAAILAYQVENAYKDGTWNKEDLKNLVDSFKNRFKFKFTSHNLPTNLEYVDSFYDPGLSTSGVALQDTNTGDAIDLVCSLLDIMAMMSVMRSPILIKNQLLGTVLRSWFSFCSIRLW